MEEGNKMTYRTGDSPDIRRQDIKCSDLEERQFKLPNFPEQVYNCHYAGWDDQWIISNKEGQYEFSASGTDIIRSGYLIPQEKKKKEKNKFIPVPYPGEKPVKTGDQVVGEIFEAIWTIEKEIACYVLLFFVVFLGGKGGRDLAYRIETRRFGKSYFSSDTGEDE
jgi:hypothetical protein